VPEPADITPEPAGPADGGELHEAEVRPLPVLAEARPIEPAAPRALPAAIVAATGGFLVGVATFVLVRVLRRPRTSRLGIRRRRREQALDIAASRSFLVDIHLLKR
jgi:hypothetical protein